MTIVIVLGVVVGCKTKAVKTTTALRILSA